MPCICGDIRCWSCGPAQGNHKCRSCGKWTDEGGCQYPKICERVEDRLDEEENKAWEGVEKDQREEIYDSRAWK